MTVAVGSRLSGCGQLSRGRFRKVAGRGRPGPGGWLLCMVAVALCWAGLAGAHESECDHGARWLDPGSGQALGATTAYGRLAGGEVILLGEIHHSADHHRWQLHTLAALHAIHGNLIIGLEMLPRRAQPVLDRWVAGELSEKEFLRQVQWDQVWGYDPAMYMPILHFARMNGIPVRGLNVDQVLVSRVGDVGWEAVPVDSREGLSDPRSAPAAYRDRLAEIYLFKQRHAGGETEERRPDEELLQSPGFSHFVEAQLTWDRAMAEGLAEARRQWPEALVVGLMGRGHVVFGHGVEHQLQDLGVERVSSALPLPLDTGCAELEPGVADLAYLVQGLEAEPEPRPLLGIRIAEHPDGVAVQSVSDDSIAQASGVESGDLILRAAGETMRRPADLQRVVRRQAPGTLLPLQIRRGDETRSLLAEFPPREPEQ